MTSPITEDRLDRVEARLDLRELVSVYCMACDDRDIARVRSLFTPDGVFRNGDGSVFHHGQDAIEAMFLASQDMMKLTYHWIHDHILDFESRDRASGIALGHVEANRNGTSVIGGLRYHDRYRRIDGTWLFAERRLEFLYFCPTTRYAEVLTSPLRMALGETPAPADYPEKHWR